MPFFIPETLSINFTILSVMKKFTNKLIDETSPYLLQHAYNPVNWYPWSEEALQRAKDENKPILVSIGYSACHWCHVMEIESFEDEATAKQFRSLALLPLAVWLSFGHWNSVVLEAK